MDATPVTGANERPVPDSAHEPVNDSATEPRTIRLRFDASFRRPADGRVLIGGSPLRLLTLSPGGVNVVRSLEAAGSVVVGTPGIGRLIDRLLDLGIVHPLHDPGEPVDPRLAGELTIVTPMMRSGSDTASRHPGWSCPSIVVDDASVPPLAIDDVPPGARLVRLDRNVGPGGARNAGLAEVTTEFVAFVDDDVQIDERELLSLLAWFDDARVALVAPRIRATGATGASSSVLTRFEADRAPLDLGDQPARVAPTTRVSYVPAAVIVCRTDAVRAVGGFDVELRWGEDVDLVWRVHQAGWRCRYEPSVVARHRTRSTVRAWVAQRFRYGTSAAALAERHPGALAPLRMSGWSAAAWAPIAAGFPLVGLTIGAGTTVALVRKLRQVPAAESLRLAGMGNLYAGRLLASTLTRAWWPAAAVAALTSRRARRMLVAAVIVPIVLDRRDEHGRRDAAADRIDPVRYAALHLLDDLAYGTGVWVGAWRRRSLAALLPSFESWPPRDPGDR